MRRNDEDNYSGCEEEEERSTGHPVPRLCHLRRWEDLSYGFNLISKRGQTGHFIDNIEYGLPAYYSGLKDGDRVVEIDGADVTEMPHRDVVKMIKESGKEGIKMLVVDLTTEEYFRDKGFKITSNSHQYRVEFVACPVERPVERPEEARKDSQRNRKKKTRRASSLFKRFSTPEPPPLDPDTPLPVETVYATLTSPPNPTPRRTFINGETPLPSSSPSSSPTNRDRKLAAPKLPISKTIVSRGHPSSPRTKTVINGEARSKRNENPRARLCHMTKDPSENFGFVLRTYNDTNEKLIVRIDKDSIAQRTGIKAMDHVIEINGVNVAKENHSQTCSRIKSHGNELSLLVVGDQDMLWFRRQSVVPRVNDCIVFTTDSEMRRNENRNQERSSHVKQTVMTHSQGIPLRPEAGTSASTVRALNETHAKSSTPKEEYQLQEYNRDQEDEEEEEETPIQGVPIQQENGTGSISDSNNGSFSTRSSTNVPQEESNESKLLENLNISAAEAREKIAREGNKKRQTRNSNRNTRLADEQMI